MINPDHIESLGKITKEEALQHVEFNIRPHTLVLENVEPFPGYIGDTMPYESKPESVFLVTSKPTETELLFRIGKCLCEKYALPINACPAEIHIADHTLSAIRVKGISSYASIAEIQACFATQGIEFQHYKKIKAIGLMSILKIFRLKRLEDYIYKDLEDDLTHYLTIPNALDWKTFKRLTQSIKNNLENRNFDAAMGFVYLQELVDFVRIYGKTDPERLRLIRSKYLEELSH